MFINMLLSIGCFFRQPLELVSRFWELVPPAGQKWEWCHWGFNRLQALESQVESLAHLKGVINAHTWWEGLHCNLKEQMHLCGKIWMLVCVLLMCVCITDDVTFGKVSNARVWAWELCFSLHRQQSLFHVLTAYSVYNTVSVQSHPWLIKRCYIIADLVCSCLQEVSYCQGMSQIAAILLMFMNEEDAFWALSQLLTNQKHGMHGELFSFILLVANNFNADLIASILYKLHKTLGHLFLFFLIFFVYVCERSLLHSPSLYFIW